jgi:hypothetical protein
MDAPNRSERRIFGEDSSVLHGFISPLRYGDILLHFLRGGDKQSLLEMRTGKEVDIKFG